MGNKQATRKAEGHQETPLKQMKHLKKQTRRKELKSLLILMHQKNQLLHHGSSFIKREENH